MILRKIIFSSVVLASLVQAQDNQNNYYIQLDMGYAYGQKPKGDFPQGNLGHTVIYSGEIGYNFNKHFRAGLSLDYRPNFKNEYSTTVSHEIYRGQDSTRTDTYHIKVSSLVPMINVYYDIIEVNNFTPYITAGAGVARNKTGDYTINAHSSKNIDSTVIYPGVTKTNFAWKVGLGTQYRVNQSFALDLRYQYADLGSFTTGNSAIYKGKSYESTKKTGKIKSSEILLGVIYRF